MIVDSTSIKLDFLTKCLELSDLSDSKSMDFMISVKTKPNTDPQQAKIIGEVMEDGFSYDFGSKSEYFDILYIVEKDQSDQLYCRIRRRGSTTHYSYVIDGVEYYYRSIICSNSVFILSLN